MKPRLVLSVAAALVLAGESSWAVFCSPPYSPPCVAVSIVDPVTASSLGAGPLQWTAGTSAEVSGAGGASQARARAFDGAQLADFGVYGTNGGGGSAWVDDVIYVNTNGVSVSADGVVLRFRLNGSLRAPLNWVSTTPVVTLGFSVVSWPTSQLLSSGLVDFAAFAQIIELTTRLPGPLDPFTGDLSIGLPTPFKTATEGVASFAGYPIKVKVPNFPFDSPSGQRISIGIGTNTGTVAETFPVPPGTSGSFMATLTWDPDEPLALLVGGGEQPLPGGVSYELGEAADSVVVTTTTSTSSTSTTSTSTSTTSSTSTSTTSSTSTSVPTTTSTSVMPVTSTSTSTSTTSTSTSIVPAELCGNCVDDDENGLVDFEDPACCAAGPVPMVMKKATLKPRKDGGARIVLKTLPGITLDRPPAPADLHVQIVDEGGAAPWCATIPGGTLKAKKNGLRFKDRKGSVPTAMGLQVLSLTVKRSGAVRLSARGSRAAFTVPEPGRLGITLGVGDPATSEGAQCTSAVSAFSASRKGALRLER